MTWLNDLYITESFRDVMEWCVRNVTPDNVFIDIGAEAGMVSLWTMRHRDPVFTLAIEADPFWKPLLEEHFKLFAKSNRYAIENILVLDEEKIVPYYVPNHSHSQSSIHDRFKKNRDDVSKIELASTTIDKLMKKYKFNNPIIMKIDAEMSEPFIWKGMKSIFPIVSKIVMEFYPNGLKDEAGMDPRAFIDQIRSDKFEIQDLSGNLLDDSHLLEGNGYKQDIVLVNKNYGYI